MFKKSIIAFLSSVIMTSTLSYSFAEQVPVSFKEDKRIKKYAYDENNVYSLKLYLKTVTSIQFSESESIESIIIGDSESWEVVRLKNGSILSIKPIHVGALTNMTVYTNQRVYTFELHAPGTIDPGNVDGAIHSFRIAFTYPKSAKELADIKKNEVGEPYNYSYGVSGKAKFRPTEVRDDAYRTEFLLPPGAPRPAIYKVGPNKKEQLVNSRVKGRRVIVDGTSEFWVMRLGKQYVCIGTMPAIKAKRSAKSNDVSK